MFASGRNSLPKSACAAKRIAGVIAFAILSALFATAGPPQDETHSDSPETKRVDDGDAAGRQPSDPAAPERDAPTDIYRLVKLFDFNERPLGNFEETPMHWQKLRGAGLPAYSKGVFDDEVGCAAAPSFRLMAQTANVGYEYRAMDVPALANTDYFIVARIRTRDAVYSRAFVSAFFIDRFGERVPRSERVSPLIGSKTDDGTWQRVEIGLPGEFREAYSLRLQLWLVQNIVWQEPAAGAADPILRRDVHATAWFDDISIYRLPRTRLRFAGAAPVVEEGEPASFEVAIDNATPTGLSATITITDEFGREVSNQALHAPPSEAQGLIPAFRSPRNQHEMNHGVEPEEEHDNSAGEAHMTAESGHQTAHSEAIMAADHEDATEMTSHAKEGEHASNGILASVPQLPTGIYRADLILLGGDVPALRRSVRFAVVPKLMARRTSHSDVGVDLGMWKAGAIESAIGLTDILGVGAVKVGAAMRPAPRGRESEYLNEISEFIRTLGRNSVDPIGVILAPSFAEPGARPEATWRVIAEKNDWTRELAPLIAHFGGSLTTWQLGRESIELGAPGTGWSTATVAEVDAQLKRFMTLPRLIVPCSSFDAPATSGGIPSVLVDERVPQRQIPRMLAELPRREKNWVSVAGMPKTRAECEDFARRIALAKAALPERLFVDAPVEYSDSGGDPVWEPSIGFVSLRTLYHALAARQLLASFSPTPDTLLLLFEGVDGACAVCWSWRQDAPPQTVELYLGDSPSGYDLWGRKIPIEVADGKTRLEIGAAMLFVENVDARLALLQTSYFLGPKTIENGDGETGPIFSFRNPYDTRLSGEVAFTAARDWRLSPATTPFQIAPGQEFSQQLKLEFPPQQIAESQPLSVELRIFEPRPAVLHFEETLQIGLSDIEVDVSAYWEGDDLVIEHAVRNRSPAPVSFKSHCDATGKARLDGLFRAVAPDATAMQSYVFPNARGLAGGYVRLSIQELGGKRAMSQLVKIPP